LKDLVKHYINNAQILFYLNTQQYTYSLNTSVYRDMLVVQLIQYSKPSGIDSVLSTELSSLYEVSFNILGVTL